MRTQSEISRANAPGKRQGQVNEGYVPDGQTSKTDEDAHMNTYKLLNDRLYQHLLPC